MGKGGAGRGPVGSVGAGGGGSGPVGACAAGGVVGNAIGNGRSIGQPGIELELGGQPSQLGQSGGLVCKVGGNATSLGHQDG